VPNPNLIEVGDTVSVVMGPGSATMEVVVISLPDNQLQYWRLRGVDGVLYYASVNAVPVFRLISKV